MRRAGGAVVHLHIGDDIAAAHEDGGVPLGRRAGEEPQREHHGAIHGTRAPQDGGPAQPLEPLGGALAQQAQRAAAQQLAALPALEFFEKFLGKLLRRMLVALEAQETLEFFSLV